MYGAKAAKTDSNLSLEKMLIYAIQDEYLAHREYEIAIQAFGEEKPFPSIINSETVHINWLTELFIKYGFTIPNDKSWKYLDAPMDFTQALKDGVEAELDNIEMYECFLSCDIPEDVKAVFTKLRDASKGHLLVLKKRMES